MKSTLMAAVPILHDRPTLYIAQLAPQEGKRWLPRPLPSGDVELVESWVRARVLEQGAWLVQMYFTEESSPSTDVYIDSFIAIFETHGLWEHSGGSNFDQWGLSRPPWEVADAVATAISTSSGLSVTSLRELRRCQTQVVAVDAGTSAVLHLEEGPGPTHEA